MVKKLHQGSEKVSTQYIHPKQLELNHDLLWKEIEQRNWRNWTPLETHKEKPEQLLCPDLCKSRMKWPASAELPQDYARAKGKQQLKWPDSGRITWGHGVRLSSWGAQATPAPLFVPFCLAFTLPALMISYTFHGHQPQEGTRPPKHWILANVQTNHKLAEQIKVFWVLHISEGRDTDNELFSRELWESWIATAQPLLLG